MYPGVELGKLRINEIMKAVSTAVAINVLRILHPVLGLQCDPGHITPDVGTALYPGIERAYYMRWDCTVSGY